MYYLLVEKWDTRASGSDDALRLVPPVQMSLEKAIEFIRQSAALKELMLLRAYENDTL